MSGIATHDWPDDRTLLAQIDECGGVLTEWLNRRPGVSRGALEARVRARGLRDSINEIRARHKSGMQATPGSEPAVDPMIGRLRDLLKKGSGSVSSLADALDVAPRRVRELLEQLKHDGFRVADEDERSIEIEKLPPTSRTIHKSLLEGDEVTLAFVSDTHLSSRECALEHLHLAYDEFAERGITEVYHAGDLVAGMGIYRTQSQDITNHTFDAQVEHAVREYPKRDGITTHIIEGNHDIEGDFGKMGASPVIAFCNRRDDAKYLGAFEGTVELPNGAFFQMIHGRGGGSYAVSYKPQKWVEGLAAGRKPALVVFGHWHITGFFQHRNVNLLLGACWEWQTKLLVRLGLQPVVGYWLVHLRLGDDGTVVKITPEFTQFFEGRAA